MANRVIRRRGRYNEPGQKDVYGIKDKVERQIQKIKENENR